MFTENTEFIIDIIYWIFTLFNAFSFFAIYSMKKYLFAKNLTTGKVVIQRENKWFNFLFKYGTTLIVIWFTTLIWFFLSNPLSPSPVIKLTNNWSLFFGLILTTITPIIFKLISTNFLIKKIKLFSKKEGYTSLMINNDKQVKKVTVKIKGKFKQKIEELNVKN